MIIGFDAHVLTGKFQGTSTTITGLLRALPKYINSNKVIVYSDGPEEVRKAIGSDCFEYKNIGGAGSIRRLLSVFPILFKRDNVDVGVFQYMSPIFGKNLVFIHDILPITHGKLFPWSVRLRTKIFFSLAIRRATSIAVVSEFTQREVSRLYGVAPSKLKLVRNGPSFPLEVYSGMPKQGEGGRYILAVGRIEARKNIPLLVNAFLKADLPADVKLFIVGSYDLGFEYKLPKNPSIVQLSGVSEKNLIEIYRQASLFVYPSSAEGFGLPLLDALLFGLPVISSDRTAMKEIGYGLAHMFNPDQENAVGELSARMTGHFADNPVHSPSVAERKELSDRFSWNHAAESFVAAIEDIAGDV